MNIKKIVNDLVKLHHTDDPTALASAMDIPILYEDLGTLLGYSCHHFGISIIHVNHNAPEQLVPFIIAHELGHCVLHQDVNTPFLKSHTFFSIERLEVQANTFAVELLISDDLINYYPGYCIESLASMARVPKELAYLKQFKA